MQTTTTRTAYVIINGDLFEEKTEIVDTDYGAVTITENWLVLRNATLRSLGLNLPHDGRLYLTNHG